jgi:diphosphomevalonate decarboxylase
MDVEMVIAATTLGPKATASTDGMLHTQATSPYYPAWVEAAPALFARGKQALLARDLEALGECMEQSTLAMHACMLAARPSLSYFRGATLAVIESVRELRQKGTLAFFTIDAGPHVKVLVSRAEAELVRRALSEVPGVERVLTSTPGPGAELVGD